MATAQVAPPQAPRPKSSGGTDRLASADESRIDKEMERLKAELKQLRLPGAAGGQKELPKLTNRTDSGSVLRFWQRLPHPGEPQ